MQPHPLEIFWGQNLGETLGKFGQDLACLGKRNKIWANLIRFAQNQNLASPKTLDLLRLWS